jgi:hypothetical protein
MVDGALKRVNKATRRPLWYRPRLSITPAAAQAVLAIGATALQGGFPQLWKILWKIRGFPDWPL